MFYYGHPQNRFFKVLEKIFHEDVHNAVESKKTFLKKHKIALYDVIEEGDIEGSADSTIKNVKPINLKSILEQYPSIKLIGINGKKAASLFEKYLRKYCSVKVIHLPSTSPANAKMSVNDLIEEYSKLFDIQ